MIHALVKMTYFKSRVQAIYIFIYNKITALLYRLHIFAVLI